jgi:hypothetical protein
MRVVTWCAEVNLMPLEITPAVQIYLCAGAEVIIANGIAISMLLFNAWVS